MTIAISTSGNADDVWTIQEHLFDWFVAMVATRNPNDTALLKCLNVARIFNGVSLDILANEDSQFAMRVAETLLEESDRIASEGVPRDIFENRELCRESFKQLSSILERFIGKTSQHQGPEQRGPAI